MGEKTISQAFEEFKTIYMSARNYAPRTRKEYSNDLQELVRLFESFGVSRVGDVGLSHLERFLAVIYPNEFQYSRFECMLQGLPLRDRNNKNASAKTR